MFLDDNMIVRGVRHLAHNGALLSRWRVLQKSRSLTYLNVGNNRLSDIPFLCTTLTSLHLNDNHFEGTFTRKIGNLKKLKSLNLRNNQITQLCHHLGDLTTLDTLHVRVQHRFLAPLRLTQVKQCHANPLKVPGPRYFAKGVQHVLWACRQIKLAEKRGAPPKLTMTGIGVAVRQTNARVAWPWVIDSFTLVCTGRGATSESCCGP